MRFPLALCGALLFAAVAVAATAAPAPAVAQAAPAAVAAPLATADPAVSARTDPAAERGRLASWDRDGRSVVAVRGLLLPIAGVALPADLELLPNAPRAFRAGWHEGIDFPTAAGTPVRAAAAGVIVRIDHDYVDWDRESEVVALADAIQLGYTPAATLDRIRGRQVWIDHGHGVVTRYAHLSAVSDLALGAAVDAGAVVGSVGSSGYPEGGPHLHLEVRVGSSYLGDGLAGDALQAAIAAAFD
jgi:murein DD-endopeptidase MepM/ murein hydrolase activator NlpD